jgi:glucokinase
VTATLLADVGGTHARFAWADGQGGHSAPLVLKVADFPRIEDAFAYAGSAGGAHAGKADRALVALAGPVRDGVCMLTNSHWGEVRADRLGVAHATLLNDLEAQAMLLPHLVEGQSDLLGGPAKAPPGPMLLINPGTGLGMALHMPGTGAVPTEGGHATLAGADAAEDQVLAALRARFGHASAERALSGPGFANLAQAGAMDPDAMFMALLAGFAGSTALATGARGGVFLAGNILNQRRAALDTAFHARFCAKGRFREWLEAVPLRLITLAEPGLGGLAWLAAGRCPDQVRA